ncbi:MAG: FHA domain-containing protein [Mangrovibacterium sp.]
MILITIGRNRDNRYVIDDPQKRISGYHAEIKVCDDNSISLVDHSLNGTTVNGKKVAKEVEVQINRGTEIIFGGWAKLDWNKIPVLPPIPPGTKLFSIGTHLTNRIMINDPSNMVSRYHATLKILPSGKMTISDHSANGTFVDGSRIPSNQDIPVKRKDKILFANSHSLDWSKISRHKPKLVAVISAIAAVLIVGLAGFGYQKDWFDSLWKVSDSGIFEKYENAVVLVYHSFLYKVTVGDWEGYATKEGDHLAWYDPAENRPMALSGTGFFVSKKGEIITNRHVAVPWEYGQEKDQLKESVKNLLASNITDLEGLQNAVKRMSEIQISGTTVELGIALNDSYLNNTEDLVKCIFIKESNNPEMDVALLQIKNKTLPSKIHDIIDLDQAIIDDHKIKDGMEVHMIGYPFGTDLGLTRVGLKPTYQKGIISQSPSGFYFMLNASAWHGSSGSPIMNNQGRLVGILYSGQEQTQGFNKGILAKHAKKLYEEVTQ